MLRPVLEEDLPTFFSHQRDPDALRMAVFPSREWASFIAHWRERVLVEASGTVRAIVVDGRTAGYINSFVHDGLRLVSYWIGKEFWGSGIATAALREFLDTHERRRPLRADVALTNVASIRVLEKCGFARVGAPTTADDGVVEIHFRLDDGVAPADRRFVVVSGLPGSGKTTVAQALALLLKLPLFDKDTILEQLFETKGVGDALSRRQLSRKSDALLQSEVLSSNGAVVSSFWHVAGMPTDSGTPTEWLGTLSRMLVNVHCECPPQLAATRFVQRSRHPGHLDGTRSAGEVLASIQALPMRGALGVGEPVVVDTTTVVEPALLLQDVEAAFARCRTRLAVDGAG